MGNTGPNKINNPLEMHLGNNLNVLRECLFFLCTCLHYAVTVPITLVDPVF